MAALNINASIDPFYRYKMPPIETTIQNKCGGQTIITNIDIISKALDRPSIYILKFFGYELGVITQHKNDCYSLNGTHSTSSLQHVLSTFINQFVLCEECNNPQTKLSAKRYGVSQACDACGHECMITNAHQKMVKYTINQQSSHNAVHKTKNDKNTEMYSSPNVVMNVI